jgi:hypothetical protein
MRPSGADGLKGAGEQHARCLATSLRHLGPMDLTSSRRRYSVGYRGSTEVRKLMAPMRRPPRPAPIRCRTSLQPQSSSRPMTCGERCGHEAGGPRSSRCPIWSPTRSIERTIRIQARRRAHCLFGRDVDLLSPPDRGAVVVSVGGVVKWRILARNAPGGLELSVLASLPPLPHRLRRRPALGALALFAVPGRGESFGCQLKCATHVAAGGRSRRPRE